MNFTANRLRIRFFASGEQARAALFLRGGHD